MTMPRLFIPLCKEPFLKFESGEKTEEMRIYGTRWNESNCRIGRAVELAYGYTKRRLHGEISSFETAQWYDLPPEKREAMRKHFPDIKPFTRVALIGIKLNQKEQPCSSKT